MLNLSFSKQKLYPQESIKKKKVVRKKNPWNQQKLNLFLGLLNLNFYILSFQIKSMFTHLFSWYTGLCFICDIFVWFWYQGNTGLIEWVEKCFPYLYFGTVVTFLFGGRDGCTHSIWKFLGQRSNPSCSCDLQQCQILNSLHRLGTNPTAQQWPKPLQSDP